jgi:anthranilate synthase component 2
MILVIDNYDSFTYNLVHYLLELGAEIEVVRNDALGADQALGLKPQAIVLSPGPCSPSEAGISLELVAAAAEHRVPLFGVCLGHQAIGQAFGGKVVRASQIMHGKTSPIHHKQDGIFEGLPQPFTATRYHSLIVDEAALPDCLTVTARDAEGIIMGLAHRTLPIHGVQFHPESIATEGGHDLIANFLRLAGLEPAQRLRAA